MKSKDVKLFGTFIITIILMGVAASATIVGPDGIHDTDYLNGTTIYAQNIFIGPNNVTASILAGGGWDGTGALFQNGTRGLNADWDAGAWTINAENFSAADYSLDSVGNFTAWIEGEIAAIPGGEDGANFVWVNGSNPLTGDWSLGAFSIDGEWFNGTVGVEATDYYRDGANYTAWIEGEIAGVGGGEGTGVLSAEYLILKNASHHVVYDRDGIREDLTDVNLDVSTENAIADDAGSTVIQWGPNVDGDNRQLTISDGNLAIFTGFISDMQGPYTVPRIEQILFEGDGSTEIKNVYLQGFATREMDFHANDRSIQNINTHQVYLEVIAPNDGIKFRDTAIGGDPFISWMKFTDIHIHDKLSQLGVNNGAITWDTSSDGVGQYWFDNVKYHQTAANDATFMAFGAGRVSPTVWITNPSFSVFGDDWKMFHVKNLAYVYDVKLEAAWIELKAPMTILHIDDGARRAMFTIDKSRFSLGANTELVLISNGNTDNWDWHASAISGLWGTDNVFTTTTEFIGSFSVGTPYFNSRFVNSFSYYAKIYDGSNFINEGHAYLGLSPNLNIDHLYDGITADGNALGEGLYFGDALYMNSTGFWLESDADTAATMPVLGIFIDEDLSAGIYGKILLQGHITDASKFSFTNIGDWVYAGITKGRFQDTAPNGSGDSVQIVGYVTSSNSFYFRPSWEVEIVP